MVRRHLRLIAVAALIFASSAVAQAGTVRGTVKNGTTGQPAAGVELTLVQPMGGMQELAHAKSGPQGEFTFDHPNLGAQPMLVRASYHGINFNSAVPPGSSTVQVDIFEPSNDPKTINVPSHVVIFQPRDSTLIVGEEYQIENKSQPARAYYRTEGSFDFALPQKGQLQQVAATGPAGMPVVQLPIDKKNNRYSIAYAFRPGESSVRYSYELPYADNAASVKIPAIYPGGRLLIVAPPSVQISGDGLVASGQEQGMNLYVREDVPAGTLVAVNVSGTAPFPSGDANGRTDQGPQGRDAQESGGESGGATIQAVPGRLDVLKWPLIGLFALVFGVLAFLLARKPVVAIAGADIAAANVPAANAKKSKLKPGSASPNAPVTAKGSPNGPSNLAEVDAAIGTSLDALKESLFRLELRHQAGTISEEEYARERARAEKVLRDLVRG
ncbi:MAG: hypothetical protein DMG35_06490 [Acidobacteria bacterium]|nr:MAG: hypothetical protein AUH86_04345 [Acidobacteria bacterium 13_1_40CM_4_58_4]PYT62802.1 MAG: hypothetical protein DMG35_06490 [Acidobacteriota bacterium]